MKLIDLIEGRDSPLYHFADENKANLVFKKNVFKGYFIHDLRGMIGKTVEGSSLTRNPKLGLYGDRFYRFTFDQAKVTQTNRLIPLNADYAYGAGRKHPKYVSDYVFKMGKKFGWQEEFVVGDLEPASRYITNVMVLNGKITTRRVTEWIFTEEHKSALTWYREIDRVVRDGAMAWCQKHGIPLVWADGNRVEDIRDTLRSDPEVDDWLNG